MFEELIFLEKNKIQFLLDDADYVQFYNIVNNEEYPQYFRQFLKGYMSEQISKLKLDITENYGIDLNDLDFENYWRSFESACFNMYKLPKAKFEGIIVDSIQLNLNLILRPKQTLTNFLFRDELYQIPENIKQRLTYFNLDLEVISKISIWLENQNSLINIFQFRQILSSILSEIFKDKHYSMLSNWFEDLIYTISSAKFNSENSVYSILLIFASDLNWNGLTQFLNSNKSKYINRVLSKQSIEEILSYYLATWLKDSDSNQKIEQASTNSEMYDLDSNFPQDDNIEDNLEALESELDEYDKMLMEEAFEGEEESYELESETEVTEAEEESLMEQDNGQDVDLEAFENLALDTDKTKEDESISEVDELDEILKMESLDAEAESYGSTADEKSENEVVNENNNIWEEFEENSDNNFSVIDDEDINKIDEVLSEFNNVDDSSTEQENKSDELISEDDEFEKMAEMIAGGGDLSISEVASTPSPISEQSDFQDFSEIDNLIQKLNDKLAINVKTKENLKDYQELAHQSRLADLNFIDLNDPQFSQTQKELYKLLIELKKRKSL